VAKYCAPLAFSDILGFPREDYDSNWLDFIGPFHVYHNSVVIHVASFVRVMTDFHIVHEHVRMMIFAFTLENETLEWYENLGEKQISSLAKYLMLFLKHWDLRYEEDYGTFIKRFIEILPKEEAPHC
jgi:hypothetical protein